MNDEQEIVIDLIRVEANWFYRTLKAVADANKDLANQMNGEELKGYELFVKLTMQMQDNLNAGSKEKLSMLDAKEELDEALVLVGEAPAARAEVIKRLNDLKLEPSYRVNFDKTTLKFTLDMIEKDLTKFRTVVIPNYQKKEESEFTDVIQTKMYWVNKAKKAKTILEHLKIKLEKAL